MYYYRRLRICGIRRFSHHIRNEPAQMNGGD
nr:MAG TPA: hypothetical protein [Caudovirales sp. ctNII2]